MKKLLIGVISLLLVVMLGLSLVACGGGEGGGEGGEGGGGDTPAGLTLVEGGKPTFQFVISHNTSVAAETIAKSTIKTINKVLDKEAKTVNEQNENATEVEIIIGTPSFRGDEYAIDPHYLGPEGYAVKVVGTKVLVLFGSDSAVSSALDHVKTTLFGITSKTKGITEVIASEDKLIESKQTFALESVKVSGNDITSYVLQYPTSARDAAQAIQNQLYSKVGIWLPKGNATNKQKAVIIREIELDGEGSTEKGFRVFVDENQNLVIETEFVNKLSEGLTAFFGETVLATGKKEVAFNQDYVYTGFDARNIYYSDFGAKGNGRTDDLDAIRNCHDYANQYGHTVNADANATYYIGSNDVGIAVTIKTDTNWHGCNFIFDDRGLVQPLTAEQNNGNRQEASNGWYTPIFSVSPDKYEKHLYGDDIPITSLEKGASNVGFSLGHTALIIVYNSNVRHYIRYGLNANNGDPQHEILLIDKDGNVDPSTPVQWDYEAVTAIEIYNVDDKPITISGGEYDLDKGIDNRAYIEQKYNVARSFYTYCYRNFEITRSNVILENIRHEYTDFTPYEEGGTGAPYVGFTTVQKCNNVTIRGMEFMCPPTFYLETNAGNNMGSYDINANNANKVTWSDSTQSNFFEPDGSVVFKGLMGTNFCKNLTFDNMFVSSFDAHCGVYNVTIKNSAAEHLNFIGDGKITMENVILYADGRQHTAMNLRTDYGSTWAGDVEMNNVEFRYANDLVASNSQYFTIMNGSWINHFFGYKVHYPQNMILNDVSIVKFTFGLDANGDRWEKLDESTRNKQEIHLISPAIGAHNADLTGAFVGGVANNNPVEPIKTIVVNNYKYKDNPVKIVMPVSPTFKNTKITVDGVEIQ